MRSSSPAIVVDFAALARSEQLAPGGNATRESRTFHPFLRQPESVPPGQQTFEQNAPEKHIGQNMPAIASPAPSIGYLAQRDSNIIIPPDTYGAVGPDRVFSTHNSFYVVQDKATGNVLSMVRMSTFWALAGVSGPFDPRVAYDPYNDRWILSAASNAATISSSVLVAVSQTGDPAGSYFMFRDSVGTSTLWADYPCLGFNKNWIAVSYNMFTISGEAFSRGELLVLDYPAFRSGTATKTTFVGTNNWFTLQPCDTHSSTEDTLFLVQHINSGAATYSLSEITGTPSAPAFALGSSKVNPLGAWATLPGNDILPQAPEPFPGTGTRKISAGDSRVINAVYRNGGIYYAQTIGLPSSGTLRTAAQWGHLNTSGTFIEGGRVLDPTATATNGGKWYAYPSITVNMNNDMLLGFSQFASNQSPSAGYTVHFHLDSAGTMRDPFIFKSGEGYYEKTFSGNSNRWGDYSGTQTDPSNDLDMWTIQEYAATPNGTGNNSGRFGTWWAMVAESQLPIQLSTFSAEALGGNSVLLKWSTLSETNNYGFEVQRQVGGKGMFETVANGFLPGYGTTSALHQYEFTDAPPAGAARVYRLKQIDLDGTIHYSESVTAGEVLHAPASLLPTATVLEQNYPNPFNPATEIRYSIAGGQGSGARNVRLVLYDLLGRDIATLVSGQQGQGTYSVKFDGSRFSSGVYFYRLEAGDYVQTRRMTLMK